MFFERLRPILEALAAAAPVVAAVLALVVSARVARVE
jgi:hypothetical protein